MKRLQRQFRIGLQENRTHFSCRILERAVNGGQLQSLGVGGAQPSSLSKVESAADAELQQKLAPAEVYPGDIASSSSAIP